MNLRSFLEIIFPWDVGPFIIKNKYFLPLIEILLREMGFLNKAAINYDPHHIISIRREVNKNNTFEHFEVASLPETANQLDYPHETQGDVDMQEYSTSSIREVTSPQPSTSILVPAAEKVTPIASCYERTNKRDFSNDTET